MKKYKALFIDVVNQSVTEIDLSTEHGSIYKAIGNGCELFCCPYQFPTGDGLFADDEILLRHDDIVGGFTFADWSYPICNNALIIGCDEEGDTSDVKITASEVLENIMFINKELALEHASNPPKPKIIFY
jgi:hypothetical protein